jgi:hypothetical protein
MPCTNNELDVAATTAMTSTKPTLATTCNLILKPLTRAIPIMAPFYMHPPQRRSCNSRDSNTHMEKCIPTARTDSADPTGQNCKSGVFGWRGGVANNLWCCRPNVRSIPVVPTTALVLWLQV